MEDPRTRSALEAATAAAATTGMNVTGISVLRVGENVVVLLPHDGVVARVVPSAGGVNRVQREIDLARWLASVGVPVVEPLVPSATPASGWVVSFWEYLPDATPADLPTLAASLRTLHRVPVPSEPKLTTVEAFDRIEERIGVAASLDGHDRDLLLGLRDRLQAQLEAAEFTLAESVIHGDGHMDNLLRTVDGRLGFVDLEHVGVGHPEWDLTLTALYFECGWFTRAQYDAFANSYGYDVREAPAWPALRGIRMLRMVAWLAQTAAHDADRHRQLRRRLTSLRDGTAPAGWTGF